MTPWLRLLVLRRLDAVLATTRTIVVQKTEQSENSGMAPAGRDRMQQRIASSSFYSPSQLDVTGPLRAVAAATTRLSVLHVDKDFDLIASVTGQRVAPLT